MGERGVRRFLRTQTVGLAVLAAVVGVATFAATAADHLDAPLVKTDGRIDINDVYVFHPGGDSQDLDSTVLVMTVNPAAGVLSGTDLRPGALYEFLIDTDGDAVQDIAYRLKFSGGKEQKVHLKRADGKKALKGGGGDTLAKGRLEETIPVEGGGSLFVGLRDDPFFFDLANFNNGATFCGADPDIPVSDFFAGLNTTAIVLEVPTSALGDEVGVWGRTVVDGKQVERMGRPAINTVFIPPNPFEPSPALEDAFNFGEPANDQADFRDEIVNTLRLLYSLNDATDPDPGDDEATVQALADILLPDILRVDLSDATGFLNGRNLADDVIDAELGIITEGLITTDCVDNDSTFLDSFPYLGVPN